MTRQISFVLPAYNEEGNIEKMIADAVNSLGNLGCQFEIIVVDDGSNDTTALIVEAVAARNSLVRLIRHPRNLGYGAAVLSGLSNANKGLVFFTDSDRQFDLAELAKMFDLIETADMVIGYRAPRRDPFMRRFNGKGWSFLVNLLFGYTARDIDCAFKLIRSEVVRNLKDDIKSRGITFSAEFLVRAKGAGYRFAEVAIRGHRPRVAGTATCAQTGVILRAFKELIDLRIMLWKEASRKRAKLGPISMTEEDEK